MFFSTSMESYLQFHVGVYVQFYVCLFKQELRVQNSSTDSMRSLKVHSVSGSWRVCWISYGFVPGQWRDGPDFTDVTQPLVQQPGFPSQSLKERLVEIQRSSISNVMDEEHETTNCG